MEKNKTRITAEPDKQELFILREFDAPVELLFKAYVEPEFIEQCMGTKVLKLDNKKYGSNQLETSHILSTLLIYHKTTNLYNQ